MSHLEHRIEEYLQGHGLAMGGAKKKVTKKKAIKKKVTKKKVTKKKAPAKKRVLTKLPKGSLPKTVVTKISKLVQKNKLILGKIDTNLKGGADGGFIFPLLASLLPSVISGISSLFHRGSGEGDGEYGYGEGEGEGEEYGYGDGDDYGGFSAKEDRDFHSFITKTKPSITKTKMRAFVDKERSRTVNRSAKARQARERRLARVMQVEHIVPIRVKKVLSEASRVGLARAKKIKDEMKLANPGLSSAQYTRMYQELKARGQGYGYGEGYDY